MKRIYWILLSFILAGAILSNAPDSPTDTIDVPILIDLSNTNNFSQQDAMSFCADDNYLILNLTSNSLKEAIGTKQRFPSCVTTELRLANYSDMNFTAGQIAKLPKLINVTEYNMICLMAKCRKIISVDMTNANARLLWQNDSFIYP